MKNPFTAYKRREAQLTTWKQQRQRDSIRKVNSDELYQNDQHK